MSQTDKHSHEQSQTAIGGNFQSLEFAKYPKVRIPMPTTEEKV